MSVSKDPLSADTPTRPTLGVLFSRLSNQLSTLIRGEFALAKAQIKQMVSRFAVGGALLAMAGLLALYMLSWLLSAMFYGFLHATGRDWLAALIVAAILLLIIVILALVGLSSIKKAQSSKPDPGTGMKKNMQTIKDALGSSPEHGDVRGSEASEKK